MQKLRGFTGTSRKWALNEEDLITILSTFSTSSLDDLLIIMIIFMGFHALLHLWEMTQSDNEHKQTFKKLML